MNIGIANIVKVFLSLLALIGGALFIVLFIIFNRFSFDDRALEVDENSLHYFKESYLECRATFLEESKKVGLKYSNIEVSTLPVESKIDNDLKISIFYIPPSEKRERLLIISSGVHGVEGFTGTALQLLFLKNIDDYIDIKNTGVLLIHSINPYGHKYYRRYTENNVDLNRNFSTDKELFSNESRDYSTLYNFLNPKEPADSSTLASRLFFLSAFAKVAKVPLERLRQTILEGQYTYKEGIFFGGSDFAPQVELLQPILEEKIGPYHKIMAIDLHTGYGKRGVLHLFASPNLEKRRKDAMATIFAGHPIDWMDDKGLYQVKGDFLSYIGQLMPAEKLFLPIAFEYGTFNSNTLKGSIQSLQTVILENQGFNRGYKNEKEERAILQKTKELYYPTSPAWRSQVIRESEKLFKSALNNFSKLEEE